MKSRDKILQAIRQNKPDNRIAPPLYKTEQKESRNVLSTFQTNLLKVGAEWVDEQVIGEWPVFLSNQYENARRIVTTIPQLKSPEIDLLSAEEAPRALADIDVAIIEGRLGVAENGAIWLSEQELPHRVLPFITQHLIIRLSRKALVADMHKAYEELAGKNTGYGVFVAGPSKTADIEQSLVKGAQGARTAMIVFYE